MLKEFEELYKSKQFTDLLSKMNEEDKKKTLDYINSLVENFHKQIDNVNGKNR